MADNSNTSVAKLLAEFGKAVSPQGSVGSRLGESASGMASKEAGRQYLTQAMGGAASGIEGKFGLDPSFVMKAIKLKSDLEQAQSQMRSRSIMDKYRAVQTKQAIEESESRVPISVGEETRSVSPSKAASIRLQRRRLKRLESQDPPSYEEWQNMGEDEKQQYLEYQQAFGSGTSLGQQITELVAKQEARHQTESRLEVGTLESLNKKVKAFSDAEVNRVAAERDISNANARRALALQSELADIQSAYPEYERVFIGKKGNSVDFWGVKPDGSREKISSIKPEAIGSK